MENLIIYSKGQLEKIKQNKNGNLLERDDWENSLFHVLSGRDRENTQMNQSYMDEISVHWYLHFPIENKELILELKYNYMLRKK